MTSSPSVLRADLHIHSYHSGFTNTLKVFQSRDCYTSPEALYRTARARGMDLVTITDHNSIDGCLELLARHPGARDIVIGEEIECRMADTAVRVHLGALGMTERLHAEVQPLRGNAVEAAAFLRAAGVALVLHHPFHFFRGEMPVRDYLDRLLPLVHAVETRNATMVRSHNDLAARIAGEWPARRGRQPLSETGGSDAHVLHHLGTAFTEAPGRTREEFLESLKAGRARGFGAHGTIGLLAVEIYGVILNYWASLLGLQRNGLTPRRWLTAVGCSAVSVPFQFVPFLVSVGQKRGEDQRVGRWVGEWEVE